MTETEREIYDYLQKIDAPVEGVDASDDLFGNGVIDSLGVADLIGFIEERYKLSIPLSDVTVENFGTISGIASLVTRNEKTS